jgi:hypothetical protein
MKSTLFWDITSCSPLKVNRRLLRLPIFHAAILLGLFFDPEDESDMFLRNVGLLCLPPAFTLLPCSAYSSPLKMKATCSSETSVCSACHLLSLFYLVRLIILRPWRWRRHVPPKRRFALFATYFHAANLLGLFFDPEDEIDMFLRNVGLLCLPPAFTLLPCSAYSSPLKMEATCSSETSVCSVCHLFSRC